MRSLRLISLIPATALALSLAACGGDNNDSDAKVNPVSKPTFQAGTRMADILAAGKLTVGTKFDQPLFGLKGLSGNPEGFDVEIAKIIAAKLGLSENQITFVESVSANREPFLQQKKVDMVVATYTINDARRERISFAGPYYIAGQALMVSSDNTEITGPESLRGTGAQVCSVQGSASADNVLPYIEPAQLTLFDVYSKCADALRTGQVDAVTTDNVILLGFIDGSNGQFKLVGDTFTDEPYGIGIKKGDVAFCEFINDTLTEAEESGSYADAWESTAGTVAGDTPPLPEFDPCR